MLESQNIFEIMTLFGYIAFLWYLCFLIILQDYWGQSHIQFWTDFCTELSTKLNLAPSTSCAPPALTRLQFTDFCEKIYRSKGHWMVSANGQIRVPDSLKQVLHSIFPDFQGEIVVQQPQMTHKNQWGQVWEDRKEPYALMRLGSLPKSFFTTSHHKVYLHFHFVIKRQ